MNPLTHRYYRKIYVRIIDTYISHHRSLFLGLKHSSSNAHNQTNRINKVKYDFSKDNLFDLSKLLSNRLNECNKASLSFETIMNVLQTSMDDTCKLTTNKLSKRNRVNNPDVKSLSPNTKVTISPILPTAIPELNSRALYFNSLLFAQKRQWGLLGFDSFCDSSGLLVPVYRRYSDKNDRIHLGSRGINLLTSKLLAEISLADGRSFAAVVKGCSAPRYS